MNKNRQEKTRFKRTKQENRTKQDLAGNKHEYTGQNKNRQDSTNEYRTEHEITGQNKNKQDTDNNRLDRTRLHKT